MNTKINKFLKKLLSAVLASVMVFGSTSPPLAVQAAGSYPDISAVIGDLDESEIVRAGDIEFEAGDDVNIEKEGISYDAGKVTVKLASAKDSGGASYKKGRAGTYTAKYNCTPGSGAPSYSVTRKITVKETKTLAASPEAPGAGEEQKAPAQEKEPEPEPEPEPKAEPQEAAKEEKTEEKAPAQEEEAGSEETEAESDPEAESEEAAEEEKTDAKDPAPEKEKPAEQAPADTKPSDKEAPAAEKDLNEETDAKKSDDEAEGSEEETSEEEEETSEEEEETSEEEEETSEEEEEASEEEEAAEEEEETVEEDEEIEEVLALLRVASNGKVTVGRSGKVSLPGGSSNYVNYTRKWWVTHGGKTYWAVCARSSASGPIDPNAGDGTTAKIDYTNLTKNVVNDLADLYTKNTSKDLIPVKTGGGKNVGLAKAVMVSMLVRDEIWEKNFDSFNDSFAAAHLLISYLLFGDDNNFKGSTKKLIFSQMQTEVAAWMQEPENKALLNVTTAYIAYLAKSNGTQPIMWVENIPGKLELKKTVVGPDGKADPDFDCTGTVYTVYTDAACTKQAEDISGKPAEFACKADGSSDQLTLFLDTYYIRETAAAKGLEKDETVYKAELASSGGFGDTVSVTLNVEDKEIPGKKRGSLTIQKVDSETGTTAQGGATLEGAVYEIIVDSEGGIETLDGEKVVAKGEVMEEVTTDAEGRAALEELPVGDYIIREKTPSTGYKLSEEEVKFTVEDGTETSLTGESALKEEVIKAPFKLSKKNSNGQAMADVEFEVRCMQTQEAWTVKTGADGVYDSSKDTSHRSLPYGTYMLTEKECAANEGYPLIDSIEFSITKDGAVIDLGTIVNKKGPSIGTVLTEEDSTHSSIPRKDLKLIDTVSYSDMIDYVGQEVTIQGVLVDRATEETIATAQTVVTLKEPQGRIEVEFIFDASDLGGHALVAYESAYDADGRLIAEHKDKTDRAQTVWFPSIETDAIAEKTGDNVMPESGSDIIDTVTYHALRPGRNYTLKAELFDAETKESTGITGEAGFVASESGSGSVDVTLKVPDGFDIKGRTFVVFETLLNRKGGVAAEHKDLTDKRQTLYGPSVKTNAADKATGDQAGTVSETTTLVDLVTYTNLVIGKEYTVSGTLYNKADGKELLVDGKPVTAEKTFTAEKTNGTIELEFTFDSSALAGKAVVVFESLQHEGIEVAVHADINDEDQTVYYPSVKTTATDKTTGSHYGSSLDEKTTIKDAVYMEGLVKGQKYSTKAVLMDKAANAPLAGGIYTKTITFTAEAESQTIDVEFEVNTSDVKGKAVVAFETLYHNDKEVAVHADIDDEDQTVEFPSAETTAVDSETQDHVGTVSGTAEIQDLVEYSGLTPGKEYEVVGTLHDKETGAALRGADGKEITVSRKFTPEAANGNILITFTIDSTLLAGKSVVAFEEVYKDEKKVAVHADINDEDQTVSYPEVGTKAEDSLTGDDVGTSDRETATIVDTVSYSNLIPGKEYVMHGVLMVKSTGEPLKAGGKEVTADKTFIPDKADGSVAITFTFDASALKGETVVAFEKLYYKETEVAAHADIEDKDQSVTYPGISTEATDIYTKDHVGLVSMIRELFGMPKTTSVVDKVTYEGLVIGREYKVAGTLMNKETGEPVLNSKGEKVTAEKTFTADKADGTVELVFEVESENLAGESVVVFEDLYHKDVKVAVHADITDENQTVTYPTVSTTARDKDTDDNVGTVKEDAVIIDAVQMTGLVPGQEYTVKGTLHAQEDGGTITLKDGSTVVEKTFKAESETQTVELEFVIDSTVLEGSAVVVFEDLYHNGVKIAVHADLEDKNQTVDYPGVKTNAADELTGDEVGTLGEEVSIIDTVTYRNLVVGKEYKIAGTLMNKATGEPILDENGDPVTAETEFTAEQTDGTVDLKFTLNSSLLAGESAVAFEKLYHKDIEVAAHADLTDKDQTVDYPEIGTKAIDGRTKTQTGEVTTSAVLEDTVEYKNLVPGKTYVVKGTLVLKSTGEEIGATASVSFIPEEADGSVVLTFEFDSSAFAGDTVVAFETLLHNDVEIAVHADIEDEDQSVHYPDVTTDAKDGDTESHTGAFSKTATVVDVVTYSHLVAGREYTVSGVLMDQATGKPLLDPEGKEITASTTFTAKEADGTVELVYTLDSTLLAGKTVVVFEDLYHEGVKVASHADINDEDQTVHYPKVCTYASDDQTHTQIGKAGENVSVTDRIDYENLVPGSYVAYGSVVNRETGQVMVDADGKEIAAAVSFTNTDFNGSVPVTFTFNATGFDVSAVVVFQSIYKKSEENDGKGVLVAEHNDIDDEAEMIFYPGVETNAVDGATQNHTGVVAEETTVVDTVTYHNLIPGKKYRVIGVLMNKATGEAVLDAEGNEITASVKFTAEEPEGSVELIYTLDSTLLAGKTVVVFEDLYYEGIEIASHADIEDEDQTVHYPEIGTKASVGGSQTAEAKGTIKLDDVVEFRNLVPGTEYTLVGVLMDKDAKDVLKVNGKSVTSTVTFTPETADGTVTVTFTFKASGLGGKTLVAFEYLYSNDVQVTCHADIDDKAQTVKLTTPPSPPGPPKTGDESNMILWGVLAAMAFAACCALLLRNRRKNR